MDQNIADMLKDAFSEIDIDFEHVHDEGNNTLQIPLNMTEDVENIIGASNLWTSDQGLVETLTTDYKQKKREASSDTSESESSSSFETESTSCPSQEIDIDQALNTMMAETQQPGEFTAKGGNMHTDLEAGVSDKKLTEEEHIKTLKLEYAPQIRPPKSSKSQTFKETLSESDEEVQEKYSTADSLTRESTGNKKRWFIATNPRDEMKEFTEEDLEQIEESLADYPSDLSNGETEENAEAQLFTVDISSSVKHSTDKMEELSNADSPDLNYNTGLKVMEDHSDMDLSFYKETSAERNVQEYLTDARYTADDAEYKEDAGDRSDLNNPAEDIRDSSCDDTISSQEESNYILTVNQRKKMNHVAQLNILTEDVLKIDDDLGNICNNLDDLDVKSLEKKDEEFNTESYHSIELVQSDTVIKKHVISSDALKNVKDTKNPIEEVLWTSSMLMDEDNLRLEEYDWDLTGDESFMIMLGKGENQEYTEELDSDDDDNDDDEGNERDWEMEKTRIEAFYRFYGDQAEPETKVERNQKVSFHLDQESSSSECYEDSDSSEEELDPDLNTPDLSTLKPEYHSESDEDLLEKPYYPVRSDMQTKEHQPVNASGQQPPYRNKCIALLKSMFAFGLLTTIGIVSFWWATENMDRIY